MSQDNNINSFIGFVVNENLAQAKDILNSELQARLSAALDAKFDEYAPSLFEKWDAEKADKNKDGKLSDWEKASTEWASEGSEGEEDVEEDEEQSEEEEEDETEDEEADEDDEEEQD
jgi:hypothetical protein